MGKVWVLDTETKGTGAQMVPIEKAHDGSANAGRSPIVVRERKRVPPKPVEPAGPRRFKVVDVMTKRVLARGRGPRGDRRAARGPAQHRRREHLRLGAEGRPLAGAEPPREADAVGLPRASRLAHTRRTCYKTQR